MLEEENQAEKSNSFAGTLLSSKKTEKKLFKKKIKGPLGYFLLSVLISCFFGFMGGSLLGIRIYSDVAGYLANIGSFFPGSMVVGSDDSGTKTVFLSQENAVVKAVKEVSPSVVSIIVSKDMPVFEEYFEEPFQDLEWFFGDPFGFQVPQYRQKRLAVQVEVKVATRKSYTLRLVALPNHHLGR